MTTTTATDTIRVPLFGRSGVLRAHALIDAADLPRVAGLTWRLILSGRGVKAKPYARASLGGDRYVFLHRLIAGLPDAPEVDHIDGNTLNCRRANLRAATHAQNAQNRRGSSGASRYRGVYRDGNRWVAQVRIAGRKHTLGRFDAETDAARAASAYRARHMPYASEASR